MIYYFINTYSHRLITLTFGGRMKAAINDVLVFFHQIYQPLQLSRTELGSSASGEAGRNFLRRLNLRKGKICFI